MRGRCLGAIVDQLVLGRFLADLGRFLINFGNIGPKRKCEENRAKIYDFEARGSQNRSKWCPGALRKGFWKKVGKRVNANDSILMHFGGTWAILVDFWDP